MLKPSLALALLSLSFQAPSSVPRAPQDRRAPEAPSGRASVHPPAVASSPGAVDPLSGAVVAPPRVAASDAAPVIAPAPSDDGVPLPDPAVIRGGADGDVVERAASGDPYFLGFAAGDYYPPAGERIDPELLAAVEPFPRDGRPAPTVYGFAMFQRRITDARLDEVRAMGVRVLGVHPFYCVKVAMPIDAVDAVANHPAVRWLGSPKRWQKVHPVLTAALQGAAPEALLDLVVDVYDSDLNPASVQESIATPSQVDAGLLSAVPESAAATMTRTRSNGWQQLALEAAGFEVREYVDSIRAFYVRAPASAVDALTRLDFVQFVEPDLPKGGFHDDSTPMIYSDAVRYYNNGGVSQTTVAGMIDSGFDFAHTDLNHTWAVGWEYGGTGGAWNDVCEHGSHVAGTILGNGATSPQYRGNAPGLGWGGAGRFYNVKTSNACQNWTGTTASWITPMQSSYWDGVSTSPIPHVINNSWGGGAGGFNGADSEARLLDGEVYGRGQMYVFAAGNSGPGANTISQQASAKNVFTVGGLRDYWTAGVTLPGEMYTLSARGPTGDSRWKPNITAPGDSILSVDANSGNSYTFKSGTSMAAPHVTGVVAQMIDHLSWLQYVPERIQSILMATAMTKGNALLTNSFDAHLQNYGAGRLDAWKANFGTSQMGWSNWGAYLPTNNYTWADFVVSPGCTRLVVCMNYVEPAASSGASVALVNDYDLYIDQPPLDPSFNVGDWTAQQSGRDNTEIRILDNPTSGTWRWKIYPNHSTTGVYYGLTVFAVYGDITPNLSVSTVPAKVYLKPNEPTQFTVTAYAPTYLASNVVIETDYHFGGGWATDVGRYLADGPYVQEQNGAYAPVLLGDILHGNSRSAIWNTFFSSEGNWGFVATVRGDNVTTASAMGVVWVDGTPPTGVDPLGADRSTGVWSNQPGVQFAWNAGLDTLSGIAGYSYSTSLDASADPDDVPDSSFPFSYQVFSSSPSGYFFNVRAVDRSGNAGPVSSIGPFYVDTYGPLEPGNVYSTTHVLGGSSGNPTVGMTWDAAYDGDSGVSGYSLLWDDQPYTIPPANIVVTDTSYSETLALAPGVPRYFHVAAVDQAGNQGEIAHWGPIYIDGQSGTIFCDSKLHSGGCYPTIGFSGSSSLFGPADDFHVTGASVLGQTTGELLWSLQTNTPSGGGAGHGAIGHNQLGSRLCLLHPVSTGTQSSGGTAGACNGAFDFHASQAFLQANGLVAGTTVYVQYRFDDPNCPDGSGQGHTDALQFSVLP